MVRETDRNILGVSSGLREDDKETWTPSRVKDYPRRNGTVRGLTSVEVNTYKDMGQHGAKRQNRQVGSRLVKDRNVCMILMF